MSAEKLYSEIFTEFDSVETRNEKIAVLRKYDHPRLREFLFYAFNEDVKFDVEIPKYRPAPEPAGLNYTYLDLEVPRLYRFIVNHPKSTSVITPEKKKSLLLVVLESLHKDEAELLVRLIKKDLGVKFLTPKLVKEAFQGINI
jgi:hypothetical protein